MIITGGGPTIYSATDDLGSLYPYGFSVHSVTDDDDNTSFTGTVTLELSTRDTNEVMYVLVD